MLETGEEIGGLNIVLRQFEQPCIRETYVESEENKDERMGRIAKIASECLPTDGLYFILVKAPEFISHLLEKYGHVFAVDGHMILKSETDKALDLIRDYNLSLHRIFPDVGEISALRAINDLSIMTYVMQRERPPLKIEFYDEAA